MFSWQRFPKNYFISIKRSLANRCRSFYLSRCVPENAAWNNFLKKPANDVKQKLKTLPIQPPEQGTLQARAVVFACQEEPSRHAKGSSI
jgi:hypothetical protein